MKNLKFAIGDCIDECQIPVIYSINRVVHLKSSSSIPK